MSIQFYGIRTSSRTVTFMHLLELKLFRSGGLLLLGKVNPPSPLLQRLLDFCLLSNGTLISIQNMTWNGLQGFQEAPSSTQNFYVPYHQSLGYILSIVNDAIPNTPPQYDTAGAGYQGTWHTERGLTYSTVALAGHEIPQYTPGAGYRHLEFLLGRIANLSVVGDYTTQTGNFTGVSAPLKMRDLYI